MLNTIAAAKPRKSAALRDRKVYSQIWEFFVSRRGAQRWSAA